LSDLASQSKLVQRQCLSKWTITESAFSPLDSLATIGVVAHPVPRRTTMAYLQESLALAPTREVSFSERTPCRHRAVDYVSGAQRVCDSTAGAAAHAATPSAAHIERFHEIE